MAEGSTIPKEIEFVFETDKDFRTIAANGAWVGTTTRQDVMIEFFVEQLARPQTVIHAVGENGRVGDEIKRTPEKKFVRKVQVGVMLSADTAEAIANAILQRVAIVKKSRETK